MPLDEKLVSEVKAAVELLKQDPKLKECYGVSFSVRGMPDKEDIEFVFEGDVRGDVEEYAEIISGILLEAYGVGKDEEATEKKEIEEGESCIKLILTKGECTSLVVALSSRIHQKKDEQLGDTTVVVVDSSEGLEDERPVVSAAMLGAPLPQPVPPTSAPIVVSGVPPQTLPDSEAESAKQAGSDSLLPEQSSLVVVPPQPVLLRAAPPPGIGASDANAANRPENVEPPRAKERDDDSGYSPLRSCAKHGTYLGGESSLLAAEVGRASLRQGCPS